MHDIVTKSTRVPTYRPQDYGSTSRASALVSAGLTSTRGRTTALDMVTNTVYPVLQPQPFWNRKGAISAADVARRPAAYDDAASAREHHDEAAAPRYTQHLSRKCRDMFILVCRVFVAFSPVASSDKA